MKTNKQELARTQLSQLYTTISDDHDRSGNIRNWCITVWTASLIFPNTGSVALSSKQQVLISLLPIVLFWILDAFQHCFIYLHQLRAAELERVIALDTWDHYDPVRFSLLAGWSQLSYKAKMRSLLHCTFAAESVVGFYLLLAVATVVFFVVRS